MAESPGLDALTAGFRAEIGPPVEELNALNVPAERMAVKDLLWSVEWLRAERERHRAALVALVRKVNEDQAPAYYEHLVPADVIAEALDTPTATETD
ncbi:hypothetical protein [Streptosporangium sp. CA-115845]|uniref:hypothetical protein n=1 Tax=Streptosporangium sp. CA-115845 TaxID=3240071 RepID=UPI003D915676